MAGAAIEDHVRIVDDREAVDVGEAYAFSGSRSAGRRGKGSGGEGSFQNSSGSHDNSNSLVNTRYVPVHCIPEPR